MLPRCWPGRRSAEERVQGQHRVVGEHDLSAEEHLVEVAGQVVADNRGPVGGQRPGVDEDGSHRGQGGAVDELPGHEPQVGDAAQERRPVVCGDDDSGDGLHAGAGEGDENFIDGVGCQAAVAVDGDIDVRLGALPYSMGLSVAFPAVLGTRNHVGVIPALRAASIHQVRTVSYSVLVDPSSTTCTESGSRV